MRPTGVVLFILLTCSAGMLSADATTGTFSGTVTDSDTALGIEGVLVNISYSNGDWAGNVVTDAAGAYTSPALPAGDYVANTLDLSGYVNELYDDIPCYFYCELTAGTIISVAVGTDNSGIDFELELGGRIAGTVKDADTSIGLGNLLVDVLDPTGNWLLNSGTDGSGAYTSAGLPPGIYRAKTWNELGYINELYDDVPCPNWCDASSGDDIVVVAGVTTPGIDFELSRGGRVSGVVTEDGTGTPLEGVFVDLFTSTGEFISNPTTDNTGSYLSPALLPGTYFARTWNDQGYIHELYDDIPCLGCFIPGGSPIVVTEGSTTTDIDFSLGKGAQISGAVTEDGSSDSIEGIHVEVWSSSGQLLAWAGTDATGDYSIAETLPAGLYFVKTWNDLGYINELHGDIPCAFCVATDASALVLEAGETISDLDFALSRGGLIAGTVTDDSTHTELGNIVVHVHDLDGTWVHSSATESNGEYITKVGLPTGSYYATTSNGQSYVNEVHSDVQCIGACEFDSATEISVTAGSTTTGIDFALIQGAKVSGTVTDADSGSPVDDSEVVILTASGKTAAGARVRADGTYTTRGAVPSGSYFAATRNHAGYLDELYNEEPCLGGSEFCDRTHAAPILVAGSSEISDIDFTLSRGGWFEGSVFDEAWARAVGGIDVVVYDSVGDLVSKVTWRRPLLADGAFQSCGLPAGTYYAQTDSSVLTQDYANELFDDVLCAGTCDPTLGTQITIVNGVGTPGIDFQLRFRLFSDGFEAADTGSWSRVVE